MWPGTAASIPAGWTRETALDARYIQGAAGGADADLVTDRGNANHTHTSPAHTPTHIGTHSHGVTGTKLVATVPFPNGTTTVQSDHGHTGAQSDGTTPTVNALAITVDTTVNDLSFIEVIFIKSNGTPTGIPPAAYAFFGSDTLPASWTRVQGDRYVKGAAAAGNGGGTGGANTHAHTTPNHTHTEQAHTHTGTSGTNSTTTTKNIDNPTALEFAVQPHTHTYQLTTDTATFQATAITINSASSEPVFKKLNLVRNDNLGADLPLGVIALWGGTNAGIPSGWTRKTAMDTFFPKNAAANGESLVTTGGATTHTHTATDCASVQNPHFHTMQTQDNASASVFATDASSGTRKCLFVDHQHVWTVGGNTPILNAVAVTIDANTAESHYPKFRTVIFIEFVGALGALRLRTLRGHGL